MIPGILHEDDHLLVVDKPAGLNTHAPSPFAGEGLYDWLRHREPRWAGLAILHRLDKETSGVMVFGKTAVANRALTQQFAAHTVEKTYLLLTDRPVRRDAFTVKSALVRVGEKYTGTRTGGEPAETHFRIRRREGNLTLLEARPRTGRTHQIRVHAAESGLPILGDTLYGGTPAVRVHLHAAELAFQHPATGAESRFASPAPFAAAKLPTASHRDILLARRNALLGPAETDAFRLLHGASDGWPGWYVERLGDFLYSQAAAPLSPEQLDTLGDLLTATGTRGAYHKRLDRQVRRAAPEQVAPQPVLGNPAPDRFVVRENGLCFELSFQEGYSVGLFLDQRDNRRRFLTGHVAAGFPLRSAERENGGAELLNTFAYTCGFSVAAAQAGWRTTSLDLSRKYLDWGRRNFALNDLDPATHNFIFGDTFDWLRRLAKKGRRFDAVVLDPPTFSQSKAGGVFRAEKDYGALVRAALAVLAPDGVLFASTNTAGWPAEEFIAAVQGAVQAAGRTIRAEHFFPQPPDFPVSRAEPGYLKTLWLRVA